MNSITIKQTDITDLNADAVVNAANTKLHEGGGVCGAIFKKAGREKLKDACSKIGGCKTGCAVITLGFNLNAKYIIHAVGPVWSGGKSGEAKLLYSTYRESLALAKKNNCRSIAFPLISSGIYGYPKIEAWKIAIKACYDFINENNSIEITFAVLSDKSKELGENILNEY